MPVKPLIRIIDAGGWKKDENNRFGAVVVGVFETYANDGSVKTFHFAPTLGDLEVLEELIKITREVDHYNKILLGLKERAQKLESKVGAC